MKKQTLLTHLLRHSKMVGARGFEPPTSRSRTVRSTRLSHAPISQLTSLGYESGQVKLYPSAISAAAESAFASRRDLMYSKMIGRIERKTMTITTLSI